MHYGDNDSAGIPVVPLRNKFLRDGQVSSSPAKNKLKVTGKIILKPVRKDVLAILKQETSLMLRIGFGEVFILISALV